MFQPGTSSLVPQVAADPTQANGVLRVSEGASTMLGPALAGVLVAIRLRPARIPFGQVLSGPASAVFGVRPVRTRVRRDTGANPSAGAGAGS
ncbi:hypothetical protein ACODT3_22745 [Streptomyces sp. 4.24]|uniref:hypothetical protein n=1 Tax=Streptomyces tritrimontium TaxID=3406573 RepID=UPI003BB5DC53